MYDVAVLFGGVSPEHDISILTGLQAERGLTSAKHNVISIYWSKTNEFFLLKPGCEAHQFKDQIPTGAQRLTLSIGPDGGFFLPGKAFQKPRQIYFDAVLIALHGGPGEDGAIQSVFDLAGIKYTGPLASSAAVGMDKYAFSGLCSELGLPFLDRIVIDKNTTEVSFIGPYILKPRYGGSSIGIDVIADFPTAKARLNSNVHLKRGAILEKYRPDLFDIQIALKTFPNLSLSAIEKPIKSHSSGEILSYKDKYVAGVGMADAPRELPAILPDGLSKSIRSYAISLATALPVRGVARIDFLTDGDSEIYVNEINTIPGSLSKYLFIEPPISFETLLDDLVNEAIHTSNFSPSTKGADGSALSSAGSIASKLS